jgi:hypothetical protein
MKLPNGKTFLEQFGPRGVLKCKADGKGGQTIENLGPLTKKRMETIDDESMAAAKDFITRQHKAGKPFFCWWNGTRMHFRTHVKQENRLSEQRRIQRRHGRARHARRRTAQADRRSRHRRQHDRAVLDRQRPALQHLARCRHHALPRREELELGRRLPRSLLHPWPGHFPAGTTLNGIVSHEDWLPTFAAAAGAPDIKEKLLKGGVELNGRTYKNHIDGYNLLDYLSGKTKDSPRKEFIYVGDDGNVMPSAWATGRPPTWKTAPSAAGLARTLVTCVCRCSSTCVAIRSRSPSRTRTPTTTG